MQLLPCGCEHGQTLADAGIFSGKGISFYSPLREVQNQKAWCCLHHECAVLPVCDKLHHLDRKQVEISERVANVSLADNEIYFNEYDSFREAGPFT